MILVRNHRRRSSGNNFWIALFVLLTVASCTPRAKVLQPGTSAESPKEEPIVLVDPEPTVEQSADETLQVALLLPFELNRSAGAQPTDGDVKRAALALDFYQGFELGLEETAAAGASLRLHVLDSRDEIEEVKRLAGLDVVRQSSLVVGPVFPKEIKAFGEQASLDRERVLQISPLAATMPTEFNLPNLVSITSPITVHIHALAERLVALYRPGDVVLLYESEENSSRQFLPALKAELRKLNAAIPVQEVDSEDRLRERLRTTGTNLVVCGSTNRFRVVTIANQLGNQLDESGLQIRLFGHPNWAKLPFSADDGLERLQTEISSSYFIDKSRDAVRDFDRQYRSAYDLEPTEFAYKGYDAGRFFGQLLTRYGDAYRSHVEHEVYRGLHNAFDFQYNPQWGYVNAAIHFLEFRKGSWSFVR